ncbi:MAG: zinc ribbon domain-containing protein [Ignavibacteria bacterium]|nr:zinc ribbon domain-containing protein [Ignavibacteria bacterium]
MPIYEYKCKTCGKNFEYYQKMSDEPLKNCLPEICDSIEHKGKGEVYRVFSKGVGLIFKGNGFYITDYSRKNSSIAEGDKESNPKNGTKEVSTPKETV